MNLLMYISYDLIDQVPLESQKITQPGHISSFIRTLKKKHDSMLLEYVDEPEFLLHEFSGEGGFKAGLGRSAQW